jgi:transglutaminase-like putative cysteine protease
MFPKTSQQSTSTRRTRRHRRAATCGSGSDIFSRLAIQQRGSDRLARRLESRIAEVDAVSNQIHAADDLDCVSKGKDVASGIIAAARRKAKRLAAKQSREAKSQTKADSKSTAAAAVATAAKPGPGVVTSKSGKTTITVTPSQVSLPAIAPNVSKSGRRTATSALQSFMNQTQTRTHDAVPSKPTASDSPAATTHPRSQSRSQSRSHSRSAMNRSPRKPPTRATSTSTKLDKWSRMKLQLSIPETPLELKQTSPRHRRAHRRSRSSGLPIFDKSTQEFASLRSRSHSRSQSRSQLRPSTPSLPQDSTMTSPRLRRAATSPDAPHSTSTQHVPVKPTARKSTGNETAATSSNTEPSNDTAASKQTALLSRTATKLADAAEARRLVLREKFKRAIRSTIAVIRARRVIQSHVVSRTSANASQSRNVNGPYAVVDVLAIDTPHEKQGSMRSLVQYLTSTTLTRSGRTQSRAIFRWICSHISFSNTASSCAMSTLQTRKGNAEGISRLFAVMCCIAGLPTLVVEGYAKYEIHATKMQGSASASAAYDCVAERLQKAIKFGDLHYWNIVLIDGTWELMDTAWCMIEYPLGRQGTDEKPQTAFNDAYFAPHPALFALQHFPQKTSLGCKEVHAIESLSCRCSDGAVQAIFAANASGDSKVEAGTGSMAATATATATATTATEATTGATAAVSPTEAARANEMKNDLVPQAVRSTQPHKISELLRYPERSSLLVEHVSLPCFLAETIVFRNFIYHSMRLEPPANALLQHHSNPYYQVSFSLPSNCHVSVNMRPSAATVATAQTEARQAQLENDSAHGNDLLSPEEVVLYSDLNQCWHVQTMIDPQNPGRMIAIVHIVFPMRGEYDFTVLCKPFGREQQVFDPVFQFHVSTLAGVGDIPVSESTSVCIGFLHRRLQYQAIDSFSRRVRLVEPFGGYFHLDHGQVLVALLAPAETQEIVAFNNGHWVKLQRFTRDSLKFEKDRNTQSAASSVKINGVSVLRRRNAQGAVEFVVNHDPNTQSESHSECVSQVENAGQSVMPYLRLDDNSGDHYFAASIQLRKYPELLVYCKHEDKHELVYQYHAAQRTKRAGQRQRQRQRQHQAQAHHISLDDSKNGNSRSDAASAIVTEDYNTHADSESFAPYRVIFDSWGRCFDMDLHPVLVRVESGRKATLQFFMKQLSSDERRQTLFKLRVWHGKTELPSHRGLVEMFEGKQLDEAIRGANTVKANAPHYTTSAKSSAHASSSDASRTVSATMPNYQFCTIPTDETVSVYSASYPLPHGGEYRLAIECARGGSYRFLFSVSFRL